MRIRTLTYCADQVRRLDPDRYLCALFAPADRREALFAVYAFNAEIARARESVSQPLLGMVRLQWWRDAIAGIYDGTPPRHEVVTALAEAVAEFGLNRAAFDRLIDTRERDLDDAPPETLAALEDYADGASAALTGVALEALGVGGEAARRAGRHVGIAWALCGVLRSTLFHARARRLYLPADLMAAHGVGPEDVFALRPSPGLAKVAGAVADAAGEHLRAARAVYSVAPRAALPRAVLPALLPASLADSDLARLRRAGYDVFDPRIAASGLGRKLRVVARAAVGRF